MRLRLPFLLPACKVPDFDDAVSTSTGKVLERIGVFCERVHAVYMARLEIAKEGLRKHALNFCRIQGSGVFARAFERVEVGVQIPRDFGDIGAGCLCRGRGPAEGLDLHFRGCPALDSRRREVLAGLEDF